MVIPLIAEEDFSLVDQRLGWEAHSFEKNIKYINVASKARKYSYTSHVQRRFDFAGSGT